MSYQPFPAGVRMQQTASNGARGVWTQPYYPAGQPYGYYPVAVPFYPYPSQAGQAMYRLPVSPSYAAQAKPQSGYYQAQYATPQPVRQAYANYAATPNAHVRVNT